MAPVWFVAFVIKGKRGTHRAEGSARPVAVSRGNPGLQSGPVGPTRWPELYLVAEPSQLIRRIWLEIETAGGQGLATTAILAGGK